MTAQSHKIILYLGRNPATADALRSAFVRGYSQLPALFAEDGGAPHVEMVTNQKAALRHLHANSPALVVVETSTKPESRMRFCKTLRERLPTAPIIAVGSNLNRFDFAFDAVLPNPLQSEQVIPALEHLHGEPSHTIRSGPISLNLTSRRVTSPKGEHTVTPKQAALLQMLMENAHAVVNRADIMRAIWETSYLEDTRTLDVHVRWLREKIEPDPASPVHLITQRGVGYRFEPGD